MCPKRLHSFRSIMYSQTLHISKEILTTIQQCRFSTAEWNWKKNIQRNLVKILITNYSREKGWIAISREPYRDNNIQSTLVPNVDVPMILFVCLCLFVYVWGFVFIWITTSFTEHALSNPTLSLYTSFCPTWDQGSMFKSCLSFFSIKTEKRSIKQTTNKNKIAATKGRSFLFVFCMKLGLH